MRALGVLGLVVCGAVCALTVGVGGSAAAASPCGSVTTAPTYQHVVVIAFENHSYQSVLGPSAPASYFKTLASQCGSATDFQAAAFPHSLPNYLAVTSGTTGTITGDCLPKGSCRSSSSSIFQQLGPSGWLAWNESMPKPCDKATASPYVPRHNPAVYYTGISAATCAGDDLALPAAPPAISRSITWIVPNLTDDLTKGTATSAGDWLQSLLTGPGGILETAPYTQGNTAVVIWFDSGAKTDALSTPVPLIVVSPSTGQRTVSTPLTDYSLLRGWEDMLGLPCLNNACAATGFNAAFNL